MDLRTPPRSAVVAGDWHMNAKYAVRASDWAAEHYEADAIVHVGDFGYTFNRNFVETLTERLKKNGQRLYFVDGNHDNHELLAGLPAAEDGTRPLSDSISHLPRGLRWEWNGVRFLAMGGAHSVDRQDRTPGVSWWPGERISLSDAHRATDLPDPTADVMFTHDCPWGMNIRGLSPGMFPAAEIEESDRNRKVLLEIVNVVNPRWLYCGHYHVRQSGIAGNGRTRVEILDRDEMAFNENMTPLDTY